MLYLLAGIGAICVVVLLWRAFVANPATVSDRRVTRPSRPSKPTRRSGPVAPDDDPDFLRSLGEQKKPPEADGTQPPA
jgi:hypothetical protein